MKKPNYTEMKDMLARREAESMSQKNYMKYCYLEQWDGILGTMKIF